jgi:hypothetical protein
MGASVKVCTMTGVASKVMDAVRHVEVGHYVVSVASECGIASVHAVVSTARSRSIMVGEVSQEHAHGDEAPAKNCAHQIKLTEQI